MSAGFYQSPADAIMDAEAERMREAGEFVGIGDPNCDQGCRGWDGNSSRCDCGNRRVYWDWEDVDEGIAIWPALD